MKSWFAAAIVMALGAGTTMAQAQDKMGKDGMTTDAMPPKDSMAKDTMTKDGMTKDAMPGKDAMAKDGMAKTGEMPKHDGMMKK